MSGTTPGGQLFGRQCRILLDRPRIMGILNVTPDSFYDGGRYQGLDAALYQAEQLVSAGADLIDVGGESTRPGAPQISADEEIARVVPVVERLAAQLEIPISVDTTKSEVAAASLAAGAHFINDISGLGFDPEIATVVARYQAGLFLMHTRGRPESMQQQTGYTDLLGEVEDFLARALGQARQAGIADTHLAIDPGIGFGKDLAGNLLLLKHLSRLLRLEAPILLGTSRKSFIGQVLGQATPAERLAGTLASVAVGVMHGALLFRVHDVAPAREAALLAWAIKSAGGEGTNLV